MALKTTWNHADTSNRIISEPLNVRYTTDEVYYDVAPLGTGQKPQAVTTAEANLGDAIDDLSDANDALEDLEPDLEAAKTAADTAYSTWYANQTLGNYQAWASAVNAYNSVKSQYRSAQSTVNDKTMAVDAAQKALDAANEDWAELSDTVEYKGGRFIGFEHHRLATMRMKYFGFSLASATSCKSYFDTLYTRSYSRSASFNNGVPEVLTQTGETSSVKIVKGAGDNYDVEIEVNEDDVKMTTQNVSASTLFTSENQRVYL